MDRLIRFMDSWKVFAVMLVWLSYLAFIYWWPAEHWIDVSSVYVFDAKEGDTPHMKVVREIRRPFKGTWTVTARKMEPQGWVNTCSAEDSTDYFPDSQYPEPLTLRWWTYPKCHPLPAGEWMIRTTWKIPGNLFLPDKYVTKDSNIFRILP